MRLDSVQNNVDSTFGKGQRLTILATSKAMEILAKSLYSNPIEAVIREVGTNAADAHVIVGCKNKPFEVYLPTYQNQNFVVRDYGPGIPPEKVIDIFATYFSSTKTEDDSVTGCLGLGSKSPLALASQFIVEIWYGGFYYVWNIYKDEEGYPCVPDGKPSVTLPTTEPTGVKITVPVDNISAFKSTAEKVYKYFDPIPVVYSGSQKYEIKPPKVRSKFKDYYIEDSTSTGVYALMGNVLYPVNTQIKGLEGFSNFAYQRMIIPFNIGDLKFSASRESLEYDTSTIHALVNKYNEIIVALKEEVQQKINLESNAWKATVKFRDMGLPTSIYHELYKTITYKDKLLSSYYTSSGYTNLLPNLAVPVDGTFNKNLTLYEIGLNNRKKYRETNRIYLSEQVKLYINDEVKDKGIIGKLFALQEPCCVFMNDNRLDEWLTLNHLTRADLIPTSTVANLPKVKRTQEYRKRSGLFHVNGGSVQKYFWDEVGDKFVAPDTAYYLQKAGDKYFINDKEVFFDNWNNFKDFGFLPDKVYGITTPYVKDYPKWLKVEDYIKEALLKIKDDVILAYSNRDLRGLDICDYLNDGEMKRKLEIIQKYRYRLWDYIRCFSLFGISIDADNTQIINVENIYKKYPLLKFVSHRSVTEEEIKTYIKLVDKETK